MRLSIRTHSLELRHTFTISRDSQDVVETVIASLERDGLTGHGEACPNSFYGHTPASVTAALERVAPHLETIPSDNPIDALGEILERLEGNRAALCALDLAIRDWDGKRRGAPIHRLLGLDPSRSPQTSFTIGISSVEEMRQKVREARGFPVLKIKLGTGDDLGIVRALREETTAAFRVDANCAWSVAETLEKSRDLAKLGVEFIEQPLPPERLDEMEEIYHRSSLPVMADENAVVPGDVERLVHRFHGINIKMVKCGGLGPALEMIRKARSLGLEVMIGCMVESSVCISGGAQLAPLVDYLDLDGAILIGNDPYRGVEIDRGTLIYPDRPGHGAVPRSPAA